MLLHPPQGWLSPGCSHRTIPEFLTHPFPVEPCQCPHTPHPQPHPGSFPPPLRSSSPNTSSFSGSREKTRPGCVMVAFASLSAAAPAFLPVRAGAGGPCPLPAASLPLRHPRPPRGPLPLPHPAAAPARGSPGVPAAGAARTGAVREQIRLQTQPSHGARERLFLPGKAKQLSVMGDCFPGIYSRTKTCFRLDICTDFLFSPF